MVHVNSGRSVIRFGLALALIGTGCQPESSDGGYETMPYDPDDGRVVRVHDLVMLPSADMDALREIGVVIEEPPHTDDRGQVLTIRSTGSFASSLERYGFVAEGHRTPGATHDGPVGRRQAALHDSRHDCAIPDPGSVLFEYYDSHPDAYRGGVEQEVLDMAAVDGVYTGSIGTTVEGRDIVGVRIGPFRRSPNRRWFGSWAHTTQGNGSARRSPCDLRDGWSMSLTGVAATGPPCTIASRRPAS